MPIGKVMERSGVITIECFDLIMHSLCPSHANTWGIFHALASSSCSSQWGHHRVRWLSLVSPGLSAGTQDTHLSLSRQQHPQGALPRSSWGRAERPGLGWSGSNPGWVWTGPTWACSGPLAPSPITISKLQTLSPQRWQVANEIAETVKKWLKGALGEE